jgi:prolyl-tRNA editing enzyme YbaK/EbsC (Cys-tRNA(Pro) deacylase)
MTAHLPDSARRVAAAAAALGLKIEVREMPQSTRTAADAAAACGCAVSQIVKSLIFRGAESNAPILLLVSGQNRVDERLVGETIGEALARADATFVRAATGFAIGGIPPFGHASPIATYLDEHLLGFDVVWAAAGTPSAVFSIAPQALAAATSAKTIRVN